MIEIYTVYPKKPSVRDDAVCDSGHTEREIIMEKLKKAGFVPFTTQMRYKNSQHEDKEV